MALLVLGIDCAVSPTRVGLALGRWDGVRVAPLDLALGSTARPPAAVAADWIGREPALLTLDAPLGWPAPLGDALAGHRAGDPLAGSAHALFRRATDRFVKDHVGKQSLDVGADRIARTAHAALALLEALRRQTGRALPLAWAPGPGAVEVYPAATLRAHGIEARGYKRPEAHAARARIADALDARLAAPLTGPARTLAEAGDDALDAAVCLLAAQDFLAGATVDPPDRVLAEREGWIWVREGTATGGPRLPV